MPSSPEKTRPSLKDRCLEVYAHKAWLITPMLVVLIFFILAVAHLLRHEKTEFLYSLF